jgi:hypothetical protein
MPIHDRSHTGAPATYRTARPVTYRTTTPGIPTSGPSVHHTAADANSRAVRPGVPSQPVAPHAAGSQPRSGAAARDVADAFAELVEDMLPDRCPDGTRRPASVYYVDSDCLIGVSDPHRPDLVRARSIDRGGHPQVMLPTLRRLWAAAGRDSTRLAARLLAYDWLYLDPATPATAPPPRLTTYPRRGQGRSHGLIGRRLIAGIGITHTAAGPDGSADPDPVTVVPLAHLDALDAGWLYLLSPVDDSLTVHTGDGSLVGRHLLRT